MLKRDPIDGAETNYAVLHRLRADQLVMRKLTAWEGPITVVPPEFEGYLVSTEFPTFTLDRDQLLPEYMRIVCQQSDFWNQMQDRSTGTVQRRKRVSPKSTSSGQPRPSSTRGAAAGRRPNRRGRRGWRSTGEIRRQWPCSVSVAAHKDPRSRGSLPTPAAFGVEHGPARQDAQQRHEDRR